MDSERRRHARKAIGGAADAACCVSWPSTAGRAPRNAGRWLSCQGRPSVAASTRLASPWPVARRRLGDSATGYGDVAGRRQPPAARRQADDPGLAGHTRAPGRLFLFTFQAPPLSFVFVSGSPSPSCIPSPSFGPWTPNLIRSLPSYHASRKPSLVRFLAGLTHA